MRLRQLQSQSLEQRAYEVLCEHILEGRLGPGDPLVEAQLSAELGVSKTPIREALIRLQRDGLVAIVPYRGARVATLSPDDVRQVCELRRWIETAIARRLAAERPPDLLKQLAKNIESARRALARGDHAVYVKAVRQFSELLVSASRNKHADEVLQRVRNTTALIANASRTRPGREARSIEEHVRIYEALAAGDPDAAERATDSHIASIEQDYLISLEDARAESATPV